MLLLDFSVIGHAHPVSRRWAGFLSQKAAAVGKITIPHGHGMPRNPRPSPASLNGQVVEPPMRAVGSWTISFVVVGGGGIGGGGIGGVCCHNDGAGVVVVVPLNSQFVQIQVVHDLLIITAVTTFLYETLHKINGPWVGSQCRQTTTERKSLLGKDFIGMFGTVRVHDIGLENAVQGHVSYKDVVGICHDNVGAHQ